MELYLQLSQAAHQIAPYCGSLQEAHCRGGTNPAFSPCPGPWTCHLWHAAGFHLVTLVLHWCTGFPLAPLPAVSSNCTGFRLAPLPAVSSKVDPGFHASPVPSSPSAPPASHFFLSWCSCCCIPGSVETQQSKTPWSHRYAQGTAASSPSPFACICTRVKGLVGTYSTPRLRRLGGGRCFGNVSATL